MIAAIVLAAGNSSRYGQQKLLLPLGGVALVNHAVENILASGISEVVVVTGRDEVGVRAALSSLPVRFAENLLHAAGMSTSIHAGINALPPVTNAALIALGDQPGVTADIIRGLIAAQRDSRKAIVVPAYDGQRGNPVLFHASVFPELLGIHGDHGARDLMSRSPERVETVHFSFPPPRDVDTREDYEMLRQTGEWGMGGGE